jgi:hypothetical protein
MNLSMGQGLTVILFGIIAVVVLLKVLLMVHHQSKRVKELELRMNAMENVETQTAQSEMTTKESEQING